jgi:hypothetical protein
MIQRTGEVVIRMLADVQQKTIGPLIKATISRASPRRRTGWRSSAR